MSASALKTPTPYWQIPVLTRSLRSAGWGVLSGHEFQGVRTTLISLTDFLHDYSGRGWATAWQISTHSGLSERWTRRCLQILEQMHIIKWNRGGIVAGRTMPSLFSLNKKYLCELIKYARVLKDKSKEQYNKKLVARLNTIRNSYLKSKTPVSNEQLHAELCASHSLVKKRSNPYRFTSSLHNCYSFRKLRKDRQAFKAEENNQETLRNQTTENFKTGYKQIMQEAFSKKEFKDEFLKQEATKFAQKVKEQQQRKQQAGIPLFSELFEQLEEQLQEQTITITENTLLAGEDNRMCLSECDNEGKPIVKEPRFSLSPTEYEYAPYSRNKEIMQIQEAYCNAVETGKTERTVKQLDKQSLTQEELDAFNGRRGGAYCAKTIHGNKTCSCYFQEPDRKLCTYIATMEKHRRNMRFQQYANMTDTKRS